MKDPATMYDEYERKMQRSGLFELIANRFSIKRALYPGSYIHISPSFYFPFVIYVDTDSKAKKFFENEDRVIEIIHKHKTYSDSPVIRFYALNYLKPLPIEERAFDLLISQYAGFVSRNCKQYLVPGGLLLANNSHGDAGIAHLDSDFDLIGVINYRTNKFYFSEKDLDHYFIPKNPKISYTLEYLLQLQRGVKYTKTASHYLFRKTGLSHEN